MLIGAPRSIANLTFKGKHILLDQDQDYIKLGHDRFPTHSFQFIILCQPIIRCYTRTLRIIYSVFK
jgi:hypothetical protein